jgi:hypothetical protein
MAPGSLCLYSPPPSDRCYGGGRKSGSYELVAAQTTKRKADVPAVSSVIDNRGSVPALIRRRTVLGRHAEQLRGGVESDQPARRFGFGASSSRSSTSAGGLEQISVRTRRAT